MKEIGFKLNPYKTNIILNEKQHIILWHVDDFKSSHVDPKVNDGFIKWTRENDEDKEIVILNVQRVKYIFLGTDIDFTTPGEVRVGMTNYIKNMVNVF